jgi:predicted amidophosphoribosyltransferase
VDPVPSIIRAWKERGLRRLAAWAADVVVEALPRPDAAVMAFVPGDPDRRLKRGHAAERLAAELEVRWSVPCEPLLRRTRGSARQRGLGQAERRRNVAGAFLVRARVPPHVVLVDDVYTTGATAAAAAAALRKGGARRVEVATFARTIRVR